MSATFLGIDCPRQHGGVRYVASRKCVECSREANVKNRERANELRRQYYAANPEKFISKAKAYYAKHAERIKKRENDRYHANPQAAMAATLRWKKKNAPRWSETQMRRQIAVKQRHPQWADRNKILHVYEECARRTRETGVKHHVDHIIPLQGKSVSGLHVPSNLQILTASENVRKSNRHV